MEDYIQELCVNYGSSYCIPEVFRWRYAEKLKDGEPFPIKPVARELNEKCKDCGSFLLKEKPDSCPFCREKEFSLMGQISGGWPESEEGVRPLVDAYFCKNCQKEFSVNTRPEK
ncbi:hypothetical protein ACFLQZ_04745 [Acidobacteriota bacterium]